jgi:hypothetical protein
MNFTMNDAEPVCATNVFQTVIMPVDVKVDAIFLNGVEF